MFDVAIAALAPPPPAQSPRPVLPLHRSRPAVLHRPPAALAEPQDDYVETYAGAIEPAGVAAASPEGTPAAVRSARKALQRGALAALRFARVTGSHILFVFALSLWSRRTWIVHT